MSTQAGCDAQGDSPRVSADAWRKTMGLFATGVTVLTTVSEPDLPLGMTANAVASLSLEPPTLLVCGSRSSDTLQGILSSSVFCVNILSAAQAEIAKRFAVKGGAAKFQGVPFTFGEAGAPVLEGCLATAECVVREVHSGGDHLIVVGQGVDVRLNLGSAAPLIFYQSTFSQLATKG